jgi:hypothetical protein
MNGIGCRIGEELAEDDDVTTVVINYCQVKSLPIVEQIPKLGLQLLDEAGLLDHRELLIMLEIAYYKHKERERQKDDIVQLHNKRGRR